MKFEEVVENMDVNYHPDDGEMYYPVKVVEKGYYKGDPFVLINCPNVGTSDWGLVPVDPDNLSRIPGIRAHCWNCKEYVQLDSSYMNTCNRCGRVFCPKCDHCHCGTKWDRNNNK
ncbi:hypothetical protein bcgnr5390_11050 [Bacillus luti]|nr:hypothetical protein BC2903_29860 [Bacillus cereus]